MLLVAIQVADVGARGTALHVYDSIPPPQDSSRSRRGQVLYDGADQNDPALALARYLPARKDDVFQVLHHGKVRAYIADYLIS